MAQSKTDLIRAYRERLQTHGPGSEAVQYADRDSHYARFAVLADVDPDMTSVLDVGCGLGDFCHYLRARGNSARYHGVDIVPEFVDLANTSFAGDAAAQASVLDAETGELPTGHDYAVLSGVFNNTMKDNWGFMTRTLDRMWAAADRGIAFNAMSTYVDYRDPDLYYVDPMELFAYCKSKLGGHPVLRHDYTVRPGGFPFEFAMYVYKSPRDASA
jgi:SAM-dependent methyltransferase